MGAVRVLALARARRQWKALLVLALITTMACGFALTAANGARRTHTSWQRLKTATLFPEALINVPIGHAMEAARTVARTKDIAGSGALVYIPANPEGVSEEIGAFGGIGPGFGTDLVRPLIVRGRLVRPDSVTEMTINAEYADAFDLDVGSKVHLVGPAIDERVTVVGVHRSPLDIGPNAGAPQAMVSPAFWTKYGAAVLAAVPEYRKVRPSIGLRFDAGVNGTALTQRLTDQIEGAAAVSPGQLDQDVVAGLVASTTALVVLAVSSAAATVILLTLLLIGTARRGDDPRMLAALGLSRSERALANWIPLAAALAAGLAIAPVVAILASPLTLTGFAVDADPTSGTWFDGGLLAGCSVGLLTILLLAAAAATWRAAGSRAPRVVALPRSSVLARAGAASPAFSLGALAAVGGMGSTGRRLARSTIVGLGIAIACIVGAIAWHSTNDRLRSEPRLQGWSFDAVVSNAQDESREAFNAAVDQLQRSDVVTGMTRYMQNTGTYQGLDIDILGLDDARGSIDLALLQGRRPSAGGEVAVGPYLFRKFSLRIGGPLVLPGPDGDDVRLRVVGEAVFPLIGNTGFGSAVLMTRATAVKIGVEPLNGGYLVDLAPGATVADLQRAGGKAIVALPPSSPPSLIRLQDAIGSTNALSAFFGVFALSVFAYGAITSSGRQRREYAVVRSIGFHRRQVVGAFLWQAVITLVLAAVVAVPIGLGIGRVAWTLTSRNLGLLDAYRLPLPQLAIGFGAALVIVVAVAVAAAARPAWMTIADGLRAE